jgi:hypothetical protein
MLELVVFILFLLIGYTVALSRNFYLHWRDGKQQEEAVQIGLDVYGRPVGALIERLGDPYEIEEGTTGRALYIWKFPPARTLRKGTGLFVFTALTEHGVVASCEWKRQPQS